MISGPFGNRSSPFWGFFHIPKYTTTSCSWMQYIPTLPFLQSCHRTCFCKDPFILSLSPSELFCLYWMVSLTSQLNWGFELFDADLSPLKPGNRSMMDSYEGHLQLLHSATCRPKLPLFHAEMQYSTSVWETTSFIHLFDNPFKIICAFFTFKI